MPEAPAATLVLSMTSTSSPALARCQAVERPGTPAPMTSVGVKAGRTSDTAGSSREREIVAYRARQLRMTQYVIHPLGGGQPGRLQSLRALAINAPCTNLSSPRRSAWPAGVGRMQRRSIRGRSCSRLRRATAGKRRHQRCRRIRGGTRGAEMATAAQDPVFGGNVETVLSSPRIEPAPATLEEARHAPGRAEKIEALTRRIEAEGIKFVFFQQVSITGRVMGKGVVSSFFPQVAQRGYQLVYGAVANLFTDRYGNYIGFGPEESELAAIADLDTFAVLPWDPRVARVYCDCYDTDTGELFDADCRQNLKRIAHEFEQELGYHFMIGIEPEMMWLRKPEDGKVPEGVTQPYCYHIHQF